MVAAVFLGAAGGGALVLDGGEVGARPNPALISREQEARDRRLSDETERLKVRYDTADAQEALARYADDLVAESARIEMATRVPPWALVKVPPT